MPSEVSLEKDGDSHWGFQLTGGATFEMPLTIFEVQEGGKADKAGIRLGDVLVKINGMDTETLTLEQAHDIIDNAGNNINLAVANLEDQEAEELQRQKLEAMELEEEEEERVDVSKLNLNPPRPAPQPELAKRKCWHPIVLDTSPPPIIEETTGDAEAPHKKLMRNLRKAMDMKKIQRPQPEGPPLRKPPPPPADEGELGSDKEMSMADQLRSVQRQLAALSALPAVLQQSLTVVSQNLTRMLPPEPELEPELEIEEHDDETEVEYTEEEYTNEYVTEDEISAREPTPEPESEEYVEPEEDAEPELEPEPEPTIEELEKLDKLRKLKELNRVWPWGDNIKPVYKISDRYKVPHSELFSNKIQSLEGKILRKAPEVGEE